MARCDILYLHCERHFTQEADAGIYLFIKAAIVLYYNILLPALNSPVVSVTNRHSLPTSSYETQVRYFQ